MADIDFIMAMSCAPPALLGLYRYKRVEPAFHPFILTLVLSLITELVLKLIKDLNAPAVFFSATANVYLIINWLLFYFFFLQITVVAARYKKYHVASFLLLCIAGFCINNPLKAFPYFTLIVSYVYILAGAVKLLSMQVFETRVTIFRNPLFYIAAGAVLFHAMSIFATLLGIAVTGNTNLDWYVYVAEKIVNVFHYLLFLLAVLWIPRKKLQYG